MRDASVNRVVHKVAQQQSSRVRLRDDVHRESHVKTKTCADCNGDGVIEKGTNDEQRCPTCGGSGFVPDEEDDEEVTHTASCEHEAAQ